MMLVRPNNFKDEKNLSLLAGLISINTLLEWRLLPKKQISVQVDPQYKYGQTNKVDQIESIEGFLLSDRNYIVGRQQSIDCFTN
jgi:hypothetical protein